MYCSLHKDVISFISGDIIVAWGVSCNNAARVFVARVFADLLARVFAAGFEVARADVALRAVVVAPVATAVRARTLSATAARDTTALVPLRAPARTAVRFGATVVAVSALRPVRDVTTFGVVCPVRADVF